MRSHPHPTRRRAPVGLVVALSVWTPAVLASTVEEWRTEEDILTLFPDACEDGSWSPFYDGEWSDLLTGEQLVGEGIDLSKLSWAPYDATGAVITADGGDVTGSTYILKQSDLNLATGTPTGDGLLVNRVSDTSPGALISIRGYDYVLIDGLRVRNVADTDGTTADPYINGKYTVYIEGCGVVVIRNSYFAGPLQSGHVRIAGAAQILIEGNEVEGVEEAAGGFDLGGSAVYPGKVAAGGFFIENGGVKGVPAATAPHLSYDCEQLAFGETLNDKSLYYGDVAWRDLECLVVENNYLHDYTTRAACVMDTPNFPQYTTREHDAFTITSPSDGIFFNNVIEDWRNTSCGEEVLDIAHAHLCDATYNGSLYRVERNLFLGTEPSARYSLKLRGWSDPASELIFANNVLLNTQVVDTHVRYDISSVNNTQLFIDGDDGTLNDDLQTTYGFSLSDANLELLKGNPVSGGYEPTYSYDRTHTSDSFGVRSNGTSTGGWTHEERAAGDATRYTDAIWSSATDLYTSERSGEIWLSTTGLTWALDTTAPFPVRAMTVGVGSRWAVGGGGGVLRKTSPAAAWVTYPPPSAATILDAYGDPNSVVAMTPRAAGTKGAHVYLSTGGGAWVNISPPLGVTPTNFKPFALGGRYDPLLPQPTLFVAGSEGAVLERDPTTGVWGVSLTATSQVFYAVASEPTLGDFAVGRGGVIFQRAPGGAWTDITAGVWTSACGTSSIAYEVCTAGGPYYTLNVISPMDGHGVVYFAGHRGILIRYDGATATFVDTGRRAWVSGLAAFMDSGAEHLIAVTKGYPGGRYLNGNEVKESDSNDHHGHGFVLFKGSPTTSVSYDPDIIPWTAAMDFNAYSCDATRAAPHALAGESDGVSNWTEYMATLSPPNTWSDAPPAGFGQDTWSAFASALDPSCIDVSVVLASPADPNSYRFATPPGCAASTGGEQWWAGGSAEARVGARFSDPLKEVTWDFYKATRSSSPSRGAFE